MSQTKLFTHISVWLTLVIYASAIPGIVSNDNSYKYGDSDQQVTKQNVRQYQQIPSSIQSINNNVFSSQPQSFSKFRANTNLGSEINYATPPPLPDAVTKFDNPKITKDESSAVGAYEAPELPAIPEPDTSKLIQNPRPSPFSSPLSLSSQPYSVPIQSRYPIETSSLSKLPTQDLFPSFAATYAASSSIFSPNELKSYTNTPLASYPIEVSKGPILKYSNQQTAFNGLRNSYGVPIISSAGKYSEAPAPYTVPIAAPSVPVSPVVSSSVSLSPVSHTPISLPTVGDSPASLNVVSHPVSASSVVSAPVISAPVISAPVVAAPVVSSPVVAAPVVSSPVAATPIVKFDQAANLNPIIKLHSAQITPAISSPITSLLPPALSSPSQASAIAYATPQYSHGTLNSQYVRTIQSPYVAPSVQQYPAHISSIPATYPLAYSAYQYSPQYYAGPLNQYVRAPITTSYVQAPVSALASKLVVPLTPNSIPQQAISSLKFSSAPVHSLGYTYNAPIGKK